MLQSKTIKVDGIGEVTVHELNARGYAAMIDARQEGKPEVEVSAIVCSHCVEPKKSVDEYLDDYSPQQVMAMMVEIVELSDLGPTAKKSEADQAPDSSIA